MKFLAPFVSQPLRRALFSLLFVAALAAGLGAIASIRAVSSPKSPSQLVAERKISSWVNAHTQEGKQAEFIVVLSEQADLSGAATLQTETAKGRFVRDALYDKSQATQRPILKMLKDRGLEYRSFYIVNAIWVKGRAEDAMAVAERADVARIEGNPEVHNYPNPLPAQPAAERSGRTGDDRARDRLHECIGSLGDRFPRWGYGRGRWRYGLPLDA